MVPIAAIGFVHPGFYAPIPYDASQAILANPVNKLFSLAAGITGHTFTWFYNSQVPSLVTAAYVTLFWFLETRIAWFSKKVDIYLLMAIALGGSV